MKEDPYILLLIIIIRILLDHSRSSSLGKMIVCLKNLIVMWEILLFKFVISRQCLLSH